MAEVVRRLFSVKRWSPDDVGPKLGMSRATIYNRLKAGGWSAGELESIAELAGQSVFDLEDARRQLTENPDMSILPPSRLRAAAGRPTDGESYLGPAPALVNVTGNSMSPALEDGWKCRVRRAMTADQVRAGELVAVRFSGSSGDDGEAFFQWQPRPDGTVRLMKANHRHVKDEKDVRFEDLSAVYVVVEVVRGT